MNTPIYGGVYDSRFIVEDDASSTIVLPALNQGFFFDATRMNYYPNQQDYLAENEQSSVYLSIINKIGLIEEFYVLENLVDIKIFLLRNPNLIDILLDAPKYFNGHIMNAQLYLELHRDPEENWDELFIILKINAEVHEAINIENKLFETWFSDIMDETRGLLNFEVEPI